MLKHLGEWGPYQKTLYFMLCIPACLPAAFLAFNQVRKILSLWFLFNGTFKTCFCPVLCWDILDIKCQSCTSCPRLCHVTFTDWIWSLLLFWKSIKMLQPSLTENYGAHAVILFSLCRYFCLPSPTTGASSPTWRRLVEIWIGPTGGKCQGLLCLTRSDQVTPGVTSGEAGGGVSPVQQMWDV